MTVSEVEEIIGKPFYCTKDSNCYYSKKRGRWIFNNDWTSYTITYKDGKVVRKYIYANE